VPRIQRIPAEEGQHAVESRHVFQFDQPLPSVEIAKVRLPRYAVA